MFEKIKRNNVDKRDKNTKVTLETLKQKLDISNSEIKDYLDYLVDTISKIEVTPKTTSKSVFSAGYSSVNIGWSNGEQMPLDTVFFTNTNDIYLENGAIKFKRAMIIKVDTLFWVSSNDRSWVQICQRNEAGAYTDIIHLIGQDPSTYMTLSSSGKILKIKEGDYIDIVNIDASGISINSGSGKNVSYITLTEI